MMETRISPQKGARLLSKNWLEQGYELTALYRYTDDYYRFRLDKPGHNKIIRPMRWTRKRWDMQEPDFENGKPLYIRNGSDSNYYFLFEGEKCTDIGAQFGVNSVTSGGSSTAGDANWELLKGYRVIVWPDNDIAGLEYAKEVTANLQGIAASVEWVDIKHLNLSDGGDIADYIDANPDITKTDIEALPSIEPQVNEISCSQLKSTTWDEPVLFDEIETPEILPDVLPRIYGSFGKSLSIATETPGALVAAVILGAVSTAIGHCFRVFPKPGWNESINIYVLAALDPGNTKSLVFREGTAPLVTWETEKGELMSSEIREAISKKKTQEKLVEKLRTKAVSKHGSERQELIQEIADLEKNESEIPVKPELFSNDTTLEALGIRCHEQCGRYAILGDEGGLIKVMNGLYSGGQANLDIILKGIDGGHVRIRRKDRSLNLNPFITFILTVQPEVIRKMGQERNLIGIGWMERFLYLLPSSKIGFRSHSNPPVPESLRQEYHQAIKSLLDKFCDPHNPAEPRTLNLTEEASSLWRQFQMGIEIQLRSGGKLHPIKGWGAKICGYALRLAGLIHVMKTDGDELEISAETMETALDLMYNLINHALAAFQLMSVDPKIEKAKRVLDWIVQNDRPQFKQNDIHRSIHGQFSNIDELKDALFQLVDRNCISDPKREETGGRPSIYYEVNPHLINGDR